MTITMGCAVQAGGARSHTFSRAAFWLAAALVVGTTRTAAAEDGDPTDTNLGIDVHGFVSQGFLLSTDNNYLAKSRRGSFEFTEVGINFTKSLGDNLRAGMQIFARDLGPTGNYRPQFDWFYLDYRFADWLGLRAGRTKLPFGLYNETSDIDSARVPILLPPSLYPQENRDFLLAQTGAELYGYVPIGAAGAIDYRLYGGTIFLSTTSLGSPGLTLVEVDVPYVVGGRAMWLTPLDGLSLGGSVQLLRLDLKLFADAETSMALVQRGLVPAGFDGNVLVRYPVALGVASIEYSAHDVLLAAEFSRWRIATEVRPKAGVGPDAHRTQTRFYVMGSYRVTPWFTPGIYYSAFELGQAEPQTRANYQQDAAVTFRYDLTPNWIAKLEGHYMRGTAGLSSSLNSNQPLAELTRTWGVGLVKTTVFF
jgi:hypothetical protein